MATESFFSSITEAINHYRLYGFTSQTDLNDWVARIRRSALLQLKTPAETEALLQKALFSKYDALVNRGGILRAMPDLKRVNIDRVKPKLRGELDRRIMASANLIKLNREAAIDTTLRRFQGWATSIPPGGSRAVEVKEEKDDIRKALGQMDFIERRVVVDQTHKLAATINDIVAVDNGALAVGWNSPWRRQGYNFRKDHKARDQHVYAIRGNEALQKGLMKAGPDGYYDEITHVGEEVFCACWGTFIFALRRLPPDMLTKAGMYALPSSPASASKPRVWGEGSQSA